MDFEVQWKLNESCTVYASLQWPMLLNSKTCIFFKSNNQSKESVTSSIYA
jgi:hypothetical protein